MGTVVIDSLLKKVLYYSKMSWQQYVESQMIEKKLKKGAIAGLDGNIWAKSSGFNLTAAEVKSLLDSYDDAGKMSSSGIVLEGHTFILAKMRRLFVASKARVVFI